MANNKISVPGITARIDHMVNRSDSKVKAIASVNIAGAFAVHGIKIIDSQKGLFVQMPQTNYEKDGKKHYSDQFHAIKAEARTELHNAVLKAYEYEICNAENESESQDDEEDQSMEQSM